jgi:hypothetical protein
MVMISRNANAHVEAVARRCATTALAPAAVQPAIAVKAPTGAAAVAVYIDAAVVATTAASAAIAMGTVLVVIVAIEAGLTYVALGAALLSAGRSHPLCFPKPA